MCASSLGDGGVASNERLNSNEERSGVAVSAVCVLILIVGSIHAHTLAINSPIMVTGSNRRSKSEEATSEGGVEIGADGTAAELMETESSRWMRMQLAAA